MKKLIRVLSLCLLMCVFSVYGQKFKLDGKPDMYILWNIGFSFMEKVPKYALHNKDKIIDRVELNEIIKKIENANYEIIELYGVETQEKDPVLKSAWIKIEVFHDFGSLSMDQASDFFLDNLGYDKSLRVSFGTWPICSFLPEEIRKDHLVEDTYRQMREGYCSDRMPKKTKNPKIIK